MCFVLCEPCKGEERTSTLEFVGLAWLILFLNPLLKISIYFKEIPYTKLKPNSLKKQLHMAQANSTQKQVIQIHSLPFAKDTTEWPEI